MPKVAVVYYSATGTNHATAQAVAEGARAAGAEVRVRLIQETAPKAAVESREDWKAFVESTKDEPKAEPADLEWADAVIFGSPTRFGNTSSQFQSFIDTLGGLWFQGKLADKVYAGFTSAQTANGGQEATLLALYTTIHHFGGYIVTNGYTDDLVYAAGGNPYGPSVTTGPEGNGPTEEDLAQARYLGQRVTKVAAKLAD